MLHYDFEQSLIYGVCSTSLALERALNEELAPLGITYRQWQVLGWLVLEGTLSQGELADRMRIEPPTLVGIVDRMQRDGWIERLPCPDDRRRKLLRLTDRVGPVWDRIASAARRVRARAAAGFSDEDLQQLFAGLERVRQNLTTPPPQSRGGSRAAPPLATPSSDDIPAPCPPAIMPTLAEDPRS